MVEQRKIVSVVFADLVESTSLAELLDPEVLGNVLYRYFEALRLTVEAHGGIVEKFIGDAVVGAFGIPLLHEDDALRAVRSALDMHAAIRRLNEELRPTLNIELAIRVGVNTGEVIASADNAMGHAINMAARLEQSAAAGQVLIGRGTYELVAGAVDALPIGDLGVKGSIEPLAAWHVTRAREMGPRATRSATRYVGRERELATIARAFGVAVESSACTTVTILAPPGVGKSRLMAEATKLMEGSARVIGGSCLPYGESITYAPLVQAVRQLEANDRDQSFLRVLGESTEGQQVVARVEATMGTDASGSPDETAWAFRRLFEALAADQPLVLVLDDLHWADALLVDLIEYVATFSVGSPLLLLCAARPDLLETQPGWSQIGSNSVQIRLGPLSADETAGLLSNFDARELDDATRRQIIETSGGVPLFVEQMAALDAETQSDGRVPPTIRALLAARIDRLSTDERAILELAAVEGQLFHRDTVAELMPEESRPAIGAHLLSLFRRDFVQPQPAVDGRDSFAFNHALVRDAVYEAMPRRRRAQMHERYADVLLRRGAAQELIGHHLDQAFRERVTLGEAASELQPLARRAGAALTEAGRIAAARKETSHALQLLTRAAELYLDDPSERTAVLPDLIEAQVSEGDLDAAEALHKEAVALALGLGDVTSELRAELAWAITQPRRDATGWQEPIFTLVDRAVEHFSELGDHAHLAEALTLKGLALAARNSVGAVETLKLAHEQALQSDDVRIQVEVWDELGGAMLFGPTPYPETLEFVRREVAWARERGIAFTAADGRLGEAYSLAALGQFDEARALLDELVGFFEELPGRVAQHGECYTLAGRIERDRGNPEEGARLYRRAMDVFEASGFMRWWRNAAPGVAHALIDLDRIDEAKRVLDEIRAHDDSALGQPGAFRLEAEARYLARTGDAAGALDLAYQAVEEVAGTGGIQPEGRARETLAGLLANAGDVARSREQYELARSLYVAKGYLPGISRVDAVLGHS